MYKTLLGIGLAIIPLFFVATADAQTLKLILAVVFSIALFLTACYSGTLGKIRNKWLLILLAYLAINIFCAPKLTIVLYGIPFYTPWLWISALCVFTSVMFLVSVIGQKYGDIAFLRKDGCVRPLLDVIIFTASVISAYIIIQFLGYDQFFKVVPFYGSVPNGACGGTLGHPLFVGTFLAMAIPSAIYRRKYVHLALIAFSICLTVSQMSICALVCCVLAYYALTSKKRLVWCVLTGVIIAVLSVFAYFKYDKVRYFVGDGARFSTWTNIVKDLNTSPLEGIKKAYPMTGNGIGSFPVMYHNKYKGENIAKMLHADGEYFELLYEIGIIGFLLLVMAFVSLFRKHRFTEYSAFVYSSLIASMVGAFGVYSWHLGAHIFYTLFFIGLAESGGQHGT